MMIPELTNEEFSEVASFFRTIAIQQGYEILTNKGAKGFSKDFNVIKLIKKLTKHFEKLEEYEKCSELQKIKESILTQKLIDSSN